MASTPKGAKAKAKIATTMREFGAGKLHSGSKKGPVVKSQRQAVAIALSAGRKAARSRMKSRPRSAS
jgi:hypothetical protein